MPELQVERIGKKRESVYMRKTASDEQMTSKWQAMAILLVTLKVKEYQQPFGNGDGVTSIFQLLYIKKEKIYRIKLFLFYIRKNSKYRHLLVTLSPENPKQQESIRDFGGWRAGDRVTRKGSRNEIKWIQETAETINQGHTITDPPGRTICLSFLLQQINQTGGWWQILQKRWCVACSAACCRRWAYVHCLPVLPWNTSSLQRQKRPWSFQTVTL